MAFPNQSVVLVRWREAIFGIVRWVWEEPAARDVGHGVAGAILYAPMGEQPLLVSTPVLPFRCME